MEWTKIPTTIISKRYTDYEILSIVKFQLIWAMNEEQPDRTTALRYMTARQYDTAMTYLDSISAEVNDEVSLVTKKRKAEKTRYNKNKDLSKILPADCKQTADRLPEQIRLDKIREDKSINNTPLTPQKNYEENFEEFWKMYIPVKCADGRFTDKGGKQEAYKAFKKALQKDSFENIKVGLIRYLHKKSRTDSMTANVSTFLNQERWKDETEQTFILSEKTQKQQKEDSGQEMYEMFQRFIKED